MVSNQVSAWAVEGKQWLGTDYIPFAGPVQVEHRFAARLKSKSHMNAIYN